MGYQEFIERIDSDLAFAAKFEGIISPEEIAAKAKEEGYDFTLEEIRAAFGL